MNDAFTRWLPGRWAGALAGLFCLAGWQGGAVSAQQVGVLPQAAGEAWDDPYLETADYDVLLRGPVHEAFADPGGAQPDAVLIAPVPPPEPVQEQPPEVVPTGENIIWIPGYWTWDDQESEYVYVSGLWREVPPGRRWTPGYWHQEGNVYHWHSGFWISETREEVAYLPPPPESLESGPNVSAPSEDHFWIPGTWQYTQTEYVWRPGFWSPIHSGWIWVPSHYVSTPYGYVYVNGYWDYEPGNRGLLYASVAFRSPVYRNPNYFYQPRYALGNTAALLVNLFVRPSYGMYYYGNFYSPYYYERGFHPWYSGIGGRSYPSPIVSYYRWKYARQGIDFHDRMDSWRRRYERRGPDIGPRTFDQLRRQSLASNGLYSDGLRLITSMDSLLDDRGSRFTRIDRGERQRYESLSRQIRSISDLRRRQDGDWARDGRNERRDRDGRRGPGNFVLPEAYRMARPDLDRDDDRGRRPGADNRDRDGRPDFGDRDGRPDFGDRNRRPDFGDRDRRPDFGGRDGRPDFGDRDADRRSPGREIRRPGGTELRSRVPGQSSPSGDTLQDLRSRLQEQGRSRTPGIGDSRPGGDSRRPGSAIRTPGGDSPTPRGSLRGAGSLERSPSGNLRAPGNLNRPGQGINRSDRIDRPDRTDRSGRINRSDRIDRSGRIDRPGQGINPRQSSGLRGSSGRPGGGERSGSVDNRGNRGSVTGRGSSGRSERGVGNQRGGSSPRGIGGGDSRRGGNRGGDGNRGRDRD